MSVLTAGCGAELRDIDYSHASPARSGSLAVSLHRKCAGTADVAL